MASVSDKKDVVAESASRDISDYIPKKPGDTRVDVASIDEDYVPDAVKTVDAEAARLAKIAADQAMRDRKDADLAPDAAAKDAVAKEQATQNMIKYVQDTYLDGEDFGKEYTEAVVRQLMTSKGEQGARAALDEVLDNSKDNYKSTTENRQTLFKLVIGAGEDEVTQKIGWTTYDEDASHAVYDEIRNGHTVNQTKVSQITAPIALEYQVKAVEETKRERMSQATARAQAAEEALEQAKNAEANKGLFGIGGLWDNVTNGGAGNTALEQARIQAEAEYAAAQAELEKTAAQTQLAIEEKSFRKFA
jgi:hypothetical protein